MFSSPQIVTPPARLSLTPGLRMLLWLMAIFLGPVLILSDLMQLDGIRLTQARLVIGRDFFNLWSGDRLAVEGHLSILCDYAAYMSWQSSMVGPLDSYNYSYPPHSLFFAVPFGAIPYPLALALWTAMGVVFFL